MHGTEQSVACSCTLSLCNARHLDPAHLYRSRSCLSHARCAFAEFNKLCAHCGNLCWQQPNCGRDLQHACTPCRHAASNAVAEQ
eukprot:2070-Heterococcus_DN1.PRE.2